MVPKCGHRASIISVTQELIKNTNYQAPPRPTKQKLQCRAQQSTFISRSGLQTTLPQTARYRIHLEASCTAGGTREGTQPAWHQSYSEEGKTADSGISLPGGGCSLTLPFICCVILGRWLNLSGPQFPQSEKWG